MKFPRRRCSIEISLALALITILASGGLHAATVYGSGNGTCRQWLERRQSATDWFQPAQWILGWASAAGQYGNDLRSADSKVLVDWLDNYCQRSPDTGIHLAALDLISDLGVTKSTTGETPHIERSTVAGVQRRLHELGFDPGPVDGIMGPRTRSAIRAFQEKSLLPVSGEITGMVLDQLGETSRFIYSPD